MMFSKRPFIQVEPTTPPTWPPLRPWTVEPVLVRLPLTRTFLTTALPWLDTTRPKATPARVLCAFRFTFSLASTYALVTFDCSSRPTKPPTSWAWLGWPLWLISPWKRTFSSLLPPTTVWTIPATLVVPDTLPETATSLIVELVARLASAAIELPDSMATCLRSKCLMVAWFNWSKSGATKL